MSKPHEQGKSKKIVKPTLIAKMPNPKKNYLTRTDIIKCILRVISVIPN